MNSLNLKSLNLNLNTKSTCCNSNSTRRNRIELGVARFFDLSCLSLALGCSPARLAWSLAALPGGLRASFQGRGAGAATSFGGGGRVDGVGGEVSEMELELDLEHVKLALGVART